MQRYMHVYPEQTIIEHLTFWDMCKKIRQYILVIIISYIIIGNLEYISTHTCTCMYIPCSQCRCVVMNGGNVQSSAGGGTSSHHHCVWLGAGCHAEAAGSAHGPMHLPHCFVHIIPAISIIAHVQCRYIRT